MRRWLTLLIAATLMAGCTAQAPREQTPPVQVPPVPEVTTPTPAPPPEPPPPPPKPPQWSISPEQVLQGDVAMLRVDKPLPGAVSVHVEGLSKTAQPRPFVLENETIALIGFPAAAQVGDYPITVTWEGGEWKGSVTVVHKEFTEDRLVVTEQQEQIYYDPRSDQEWADVFNRRSTSEPRPLWSGPFQHPLEGDPEITTYFGEIRFVNGTETGRHSGMDFGVPEGTPFKAPARGKVILAKSLILSGNTVMLDHGLNLFTAYYHAASLNVKEGDMVEPGQVLGTVGSTGFSTGPHLHWTATIGNTPVDAWPLTQAAPFGINP